MQFGLETRVVKIDISKFIYLKSPHFLNYIIIKIINQLIIHIEKDESYYVCHELTGRQEDLIAGLNRLCSPRLGLTFAAKMLTSGQFEGRVILYEADRYPFGCIGPCRFIWKPQDEANSSDERKIWLWSHPSVYLDVQKQLINIWNMTPIEEEPSTKEDSSPKVRFSLFYLNHFIMN